jgi:DNA polymerase III subunit beta
MRLTARAGDVARALALVSLGVTKRTAGAAVRLSAADGEVSLAATDMKLAIATKAIVTAILEPGSAATSIERLAGVMSSLPPAASVTIATNKTAAAIVCGNHRSRLATITELPAMIALDDETGRIEISGADCMVLLEPLPAASGEETRFYLTGVNWQSIDGRLVATATDGTTLIRTSIAAGTFSEGRDLIIPREAAAVLAKLLKSTRLPAVTLRRSKRLISVSCSSFSFVSRLIDCTYPDCRPVIPPPSSNAVTCERTLLIDSIGTLANVSTTQETPLILLHFGEEPLLYISLAKEPETGSDYLDADTSGTGQVVVQLTLLLQMLGEVSGENVRLEFSEGRPLRITGEGDKLALVSPMKWNFETGKTARARPLGRDAD